MKVRNLFILLFFTLILAPSCATKTKSDTKTTKQASMPSYHEYRAMIDRD